MPKFKNYRNKYTKSHVIYSNEDFVNMNINDVVRRNSELKSQYQQIGLPSTEELKNSSNVVYVNEYTRDDGTVVHAHWRSKPEGVSSVGNGGFMPENQPVIFDEKPYPEYNPQPERKYSPDYSNIVLQGGVSIDDEIPKIAGGEGGVLGTIIDAIPVVLDILSYIIGNSSNMYSNDIENLSLSDVSANTGMIVQNVPNLQTYDIKSVNTQNKSARIINPKEFIKKFVEKIQNENNANVLNNNVETKKGVIPTNNVKSDSRNVDKFGFIPVSNQNALQTLNPQDVEFEPVEANRTIQHSLKPLSSNTQDYINELLKNYEYDSRNDMNLHIQKFIDKYRKKEDVVEPNQSDNGKSWIRPCSKYPITSKYGYRVHPVFKTKKFHDGIDIGAHENTPIDVCADGKVVMAQWNGGYGKYVEVDHYDGSKSFYGHLSQINVKKGQLVHKGDIIGRVGSTGYSTGPHLHWGARNKNGKSINPLEQVKK